MQGFFVKNLGCKVNKVESDSFMRRLQSAGFLAVASSEAEVAIVNTCTVTAEADSKSRKAVRQLAGGENLPWVIVTGCGVVGNAEQFLGISDKVLVIADREEAYLKAIEFLKFYESVDLSSGDYKAVDKKSLSISEDCLSAPFARVSQEHNDFLSAGVQGELEAGSVLSSNFNTRVGIKVQDGCDNRCSFCIVSTVRGPARSVELGQIVDECKIALGQGKRELVFTGINLGQYFSGRETLVGLLKAVLPAVVNAQGRLRLSSIEPPELTDELLEVIADSDHHICGHLHLPLQSGSDLILKAMNRKYSSDFFLERVAAAKKLLPQIAITTDVIVGFPGETDSDFNQTAEVCRAAALMQMHVFKYSKRAGTPAAKMDKQVSGVVAMQRSKQLRAIAVQLREQDALSRIGKTEAVLVETPNRGRSESYYPVKLNGSYNRGDLLPMTFTGYRDGQMIV
jgi:threonylcarbamoyladenosine tRNA methylthiotransferase MtaB